MERLLIITLVNAAAVWVAAAIVGGVELSSSWTGVLLVGALFGAVNAFLKPLALFLSLPAILLTLGFFMLIVNAILLSITAAITDHLSIDGFGSAILGAIVVSIVSWAISTFLPEDKKPNRPRPNRQMPNRTPEA